MKKMIVQNNRQMSRKTDKIMKKNIRTNKRNEQKNAQLSKRMLNSLEIYSILSSDYKAGMHGREIARKSEKG